MKLHLSLKLLFACCWYTCFASAQRVAQDTSNYAIAIQSAIDAYQQYLSPQTSLYNGVEYINYANTINEGSPFFDYKFQLGSVTYDGIWYQHVPIIYDEVLGEVVIKDVYGRGDILLNTQKVSGFSLLEHNFVKLSPATTGSPQIRPGFYDVLYQGKTGVYLRQTKKILETLNVSSGVSRVIDVQNDYFIRKGPIFYSVNNKHDVLKVVNDKKKEIQQFIRKNKLNLRQGKTAALIKVAAYYDQLTNK